MHPTPHPPAALSAKFLYAFKCMYLLLCSFARLKLHKDMSTEENTQANVFVCDVEKRNS